MRFDEELSVLLAYELSEEALQTTMTSISTIQLKSFTPSDSIECKIYEADNPFTNDALDRMIKAIQSQSHY
jgi:hypothetical protein